MVFLLVVQNLKNSSGVRFLIMGQKVTSNAISENIALVVLLDDEGLGVGLAVGCDDDEALGDQWVLDQLENGSSKY